MTTLTSHNFAELSVGMSTEVARLCVTDDLDVFADANGNLKPIHLPTEDGDGAVEVVARRCGSER